MLATSSDDTFDVLRWAKKVFGNGNGRGVLEDLLVPHQEFNGRWQVDTCKSIVYLVLSNYV